MSALIAEPLSHIQPTAVRWLWPRFLPRGKIALFDGDPGIGKSLVTIDLAARLSRGDALPDGTPVERPHVTLLLSAEDDAADTTHPRAAAAGANLDRVIVVTSGGDQPLTFPARLPELELLVRTHRADLVVIDPVMAFLPPSVAANADQSIRLVLTPLALLAAKTDCAVVLVRHLRKTAGRALYRGLGSIGFIAAARTGWLAARRPADPGSGVLAVTKTNLADPPPPLAYRIETTPAGPVIEWGGPTTDTVGELAELPTLVLKPRDRAAAWLHDLLAGGPQPAAAMYAAAATAGIPDRTLERAKGDLGVKSCKVGRADQVEWYWYDPAAAWPADAAFRKPYELPPLGPL